MILSLLATPAMAQEIPSSPIAKAQLLIDAPHIRKGEPVWALVLFTLPEHWHIYWRNPGDSGLETKLAWTLPEGLRAGEIHWPTPERIETSGLVNYGYSTKVILPVMLTPSRDSIEGDITVKADWLACNDICIPESATLTAKIPQANPQASLLESEARASLPQPFDGGATYSLDSEQVTLALTMPAGWKGKSPFDFFPIDDGVRSNASHPEASVHDLELQLRFPRGSGDAPPTWHGVLTTSDGAYDIAATQTVANAAPIANETVPLLVTLVLAFLGGLLLNLMPCVLPILSLKALAVAKKSGAEQRAVRLQGIAYTLGVVASFMAIAAIMLALKSAGAAIGWGFQLQEPSVIAALMLLMLAVALNLLGLFELPVLFGNRQADSSSTRGAFLTGALAVALATPCTAPFMAPAIGATLALSAPVALLVFAALGLGMALPFLVISLSPAMRKFLPKPGVWMLRFKQFLAFPMFATSAWLLWVLVQINGVMGMGVALTGAVLIVWLLWWAQLPGSRARRIVLLLAAALIAIWTISAQPPAQGTMPPMAHGEAFSAAKLDGLRAEGRPVFVDATAAWCLTCKINERIALDDSAVKAAFTEKNVALLIADWTMRDSAITEYLASFGRNGVPLYVYYPPGKAPVVLPQLLTPGAVLSAMNNDVKE
jgi:thiol:disulfide interchange protein DsbD